jgi:ATP-binding cassette subfamily B protein RaxB
MLPELNFARSKRLDVILAAEGAECGLACMAMVARYHGHDIDLNALRKRYSISLTGATLRHLINLGDQLGLACRPLRVDLASLRKVRLPAILHWNLNHFVVLKSIDRRRAVIHDPGFGVKRLPLARLSEHFTGVVLELDRSETFKPVKARDPVRLSSLWSRMRGFWGAFAQLVILSVLLQAIALVLPLEVQLVVDQALMTGDLELLTVLAAAFGALIVIQALIELTRAWSIQVLGHMMTFQIVGNLVHHLLRLPSDYFERRHAGDIISRIDSGSQIQDVLTRGAISVLLDGVTALTVGMVLFVYSPMLATIALAGLVVHMAVVVIAFPNMRMRIEEEIIQRAAERTHMMETVRSAMSFKVMGGEAVRESAWRNLYANIMNASVSVGKYSISLAMSQRITSGLTAVLIVYFAARAVIEASGFSVGMLFAFLAFRQTFSERMIGLVNEVTKIQFLRIHLDRMNDIVATEPEAAATGAVLLPLGGALNLRNVTFRYGALNRAVLQNVDVEIGDGEFVAITGPSGGGKTTLMKVLLGLVTPSDGIVEIDGIAANQATWRGLREKVGVVFQDDRLMSGTIADNIGFFDPQLDMGRVAEAAKAAQIHTDIMHLPMQYLSLVGDMGSALSGGQKQRILIARALFREPKLLFLDEGTANLDEAAEEAIVELVAQLSMTRIVIAHRPALIRRADRVIVVADGKLHEQIRPAAVA